MAITAAARPNPLIARHHWYFETFFIIFLNGLKLVFNNDHYRRYTWMVCALAHIARPIFNQQ
jgi:hypothetical protein